MRWMHQYVANRNIFRDCLKLFPPIIGIPQAVRQGIPDRRKTASHNQHPVILVYRRRRRFWHATQDCVAPYVDIILHRAQFWTKSAASGSVRWCCFRSCWTVLSHEMWGRPGCLLQSAGGEANRILLAFALSSMRIICPNRVSLCDWIIAVSLGCFVSRHTSVSWVVKGNQSDSQW